MKCGTWWQGRDKWAHNLGGREPPSVIDPTSRTELLPRLIGFGDSREAEFWLKGAALYSDAAQQTIEEKAGANFKWPYEAYSATQFIKHAPPRAWVLMILVDLEQLSGDPRLPVEGDKAGITWWKDKESRRWNGKVMRSPPATISTASARRYNVAVLTEQPLDSEAPPELCIDEFVAHFQFSSPPQSDMDGFKMVRLLYGDYNLGIEPKSWIRKIFLAANNFERPKYVPLFDPIAPWFVGMVAHLNQKRREAVFRGCNCQLDIIRGPPGTGKTVTIGYMGCALIRGMRKVMFTAPTNDAIEEDLDKMVEVGRRLGLDTSRFIWVKAGSSMTSVDWDTDAMESEEEVGSNFAAFDGHVRSTMRASIAGGSRHPNSIARLLRTRIQVLKAANWVFDGDVEETRLLRRSYSLQQILRGLEKQGGGDTGNRDGGATTERGMAFLRKYFNVTASILHSSVRR